MTYLQELSQALRTQRMLMKHRPERTVVRAGIYAIWWVGFGLFFAIVNGIAHGTLGTRNWWLGELPGHMIVSACVTLYMLLGFRCFERLAPQGWLTAIMGWRDWRSAMFFSLSYAMFALLGVVTGMLAVDHIWSGNDLRQLLGNRSFWAQFLTASAVISLIVGFRYRARWKQEALQARVTEAQLKLLQGQIEPHFLFNTLANVQSLIDFDTDRAKLMLERFTDYLRASLGQLRNETTTLTQEFAMLDAYLALMQLRMGERLRVRLDLPAELASLELPPLLLQPLVENAIHHGLEPKIAGGEIVVTARRTADSLILDVEDDGQGLGGPKRRGGNGVALENIRARLTARWGPMATLDLLPRDGGGTRARIRIPSAH